MGCNSSICSRCVLESVEGGLYYLSADHRLDNVEERERITSSGGEVGCLNTGGGTERQHLNCRGMSPNAAASQIVKEAVQVKGLRDDTTCIVVDLQPQEKQNPPAPPPKKHGKGVFKSMFRKKSSELESQQNKEHFELEPDNVEEIFEEGSAMLSLRLDSKYPLCNMFKLFICAVYQVEIKPGEGISIHASSLPTRNLRPWDGPFLCTTCQEKKEAMEGKRPSGDGRYSSGND